MLLKLFKGTTPGVIFLIAFTMGITWVSAFLYPQNPPQAAYETNPMVLYAILKQITGGNLTGGVIFSLFSLTVMLFLIVGFNTSVFFINERTFLPALFYILFSAVFPQQQVMNPVLPASVFLMIALIRIMSAYRKQGTAFNFFDAGMLISIASMFYANIIWFGLLMIVGIVLLRTGNIKEISLSILGLLTPYLLLSAFYYVSGIDIGAFLADLNYNLFGRHPGYSFSRPILAVIVLTAIIILVSIVFLILRINTKKIKSRKTFYLLLWTLFISLVLYLVLPSVSVEMIWITGIPASYLLSHYFVFVRKKIIPEILFSGMFLLVLLIQAFYIF